MKQTPVGHRAIQHPHALTILARAFLTQDRLVRTSSIGLQDALPTVRTTSLAILFEPIIDERNFITRSNSVHEATQGQEKT